MASFFIPISLVVEVIILEQSLDVVIVIWKSDIKGGFRRQARFLTRAVSYML
jgi:hypothetical protein